MRKSYSIVLLVDPPKVGEVLRIPACRLLVSNIRRSSDAFMVAAKSGYFLTPVVVRKIGGGKYKVVPQ